MNRASQTLLIIAIFYTSLSCYATTVQIDIKTPPGFIAVTDKQNEFVQRVRQLERGMSRDAVIDRLGQPVNEQPQYLMYMVVEDASGGYYVEAVLFFDDKGLADGKLGFGHIDIHMINE